MTDAGRADQEGIPAVVIVLLDLEGTVYQDDALLPGAPKAVAWLQDRPDVVVRSLNNHDGKSPHTLARELQSMGLPSKSSASLHRQGRWPPFSGSAPAAPTTCSSPRPLGL